MKIRRRRFLEMNNSQGFLIPIDYTKQRLEGGLEAGKIYDLEITESEETDNEDDA